MSSKNGTRTPEDFEPLDLSVFAEQEKIAVNCTTEEDALHFLAAMLVQYPQKTPYWTWPRTNFDGHTNRCYCAGLNPNDKYDRMMFGTIHSFKEDGYTVIPFTDLHITSALEESDQSIDFLFGGVVSG